MARSRRKSTVEAANANQGNPELVLYTGYRSFDDAYARAVYTTSKRAAHADVLSRRH